MDMASQLGCEIAPCSGLAGLTKAAHLREAVSDLRLCRRSRVFIAVELHFPTIAPV